MKNEINGNFCTTWGNGKNYGLNYKDKGIKG